MASRVGVHRNQPPVAQNSFPMFRCAPAFNYCRDKHETKIVEDDTVLGDHHDEKALFTSPDLCLDLRYYVDTHDESVPGPRISLSVTDMSDRGLLGPAITSEFELEEGQCVIFVMRQYTDQAKNYKSKAHAEAAKPSQKKADSMNVDMETLLAGVTQLRPDGDPIINRVSTGDEISVWILSSDASSIGIAQRPSQCEC